MAKPLPMESALAVIDTWLNHPSARVLAPIDRHAGILGRLLPGAGAGGHLTTDVHLAALAIEHNAELASFDRDFAPLTPGCAGSCCRDVPDNPPRETMTT